MGIKFIQPSETIKVVSIQDDAIDRENSDLPAYQADYDVKHLKFLPDVKPTYFIISHVLSPDLVAIQQDHYVADIPKIEPGMEMSDIQKNKITIRPVKTGEMMVKYFRAGCKSFIHDDVTLTMTESVVNTIPSMILQELGAFIMGRSLLPDTKKK